MEWQILVGIGGFFITVGGIIYGIGKTMGWLNGKFESQDKAIADWKQSEEEKRRQWEEMWETRMLPECRKEFKSIQDGLNDLSTKVGSLEGAVNTIKDFVVKGNHNHADNPNKQE